MKHPLHPALVHFPIACWSLAFAADAASLLWGEPAWRLAGLFMAIGTALALPAMATGLIDFLKLPAGHSGASDVERHMYCVLGAWLAFASSLGVRVEGLQLLPPGGVALGLSATGFVVLCVAGWLGGRLVYTHGIGQARRDVN
jgi:uncharacterized membrane protein